MCVSTGSRGEVWGKVATSRFDKRGLLRRPARLLLQGESEGEEGLADGEDGGEEGRKEDAERPCVLGKPKSSLMRLNKDLKEEGRAGAPCASGSVLPSASGSGRQTSQPAVRSGRRWTPRRTLRRDQRKERLHSNLTGFRKCPKCR